MKFIISILLLLSVLLPTPYEPQFTQLPVSPDDLQGVQWFGNTLSAWSLWNTDSHVYDYCQELHCGLDLLAEWKTIVRAGIEGVVIYARQADYEGPFKVIIQAGDYEIIYGHLECEPFVQEGDHVKPWTALGHIGNASGIDGGGMNHLHLEVRKDNVSYDPELFMKENLISNLSITANQQENKDLQIFTTDGIIKFDTTDIKQIRHSQNIYWEKGLVK